MTVAYEYLYYFFSGSHAVVEAKITNLEADAPPGRVYHWLRVDAEQVHKLEFRSMGERDGQHFREFAQGGLVFDAERAELDLGDAAIELAVGDPSAVPADLDDRVRTHLQGLI